MHVHISLYVVVLSQNTAMVGKTLFWGSCWRMGGTTSFQFSSREEQKIFKAA